MIKKKYTGATRAVYVAITNSCYVAGRYAVTKNAYIYVLFYNQDINANDRKRKRPDGQRSYSAIQAASYTKQTNIAPVVLCRLTNTAMQQRSAPQ